MVSEKELFRFFESLRSHLPADRGKPLLKALRRLCGCKACALHSGKHVPLLYGIGTIDGFTRFTRAWLASTGALVYCIRLEV